MTPLRIFVSSVQKELVEERAALHSYLNCNRSMRWFGRFLFEEAQVSLVLASSLPGRSGSRNHEDRSAAGQRSSPRWENSLGAPAVVTVWSRVSFEGEIRETIAVCRCRRPWGFPFWGLADGVGINDRTGRVADPQVEAPRGSNAWAPTGPDQWCVIGDDDG